MLTTILVITLTAFQSHPDGTLVMSQKPNTIIGNAAKRLTNNDQYTHIGIVVNGRVYESDWPRAKATPIQQYGKPRTINDYYEPVVPFTKSQVASMHQSVSARVGQPYQLRNYLRPNSRKTQGTWCSPFVLQTLNDSKRYSLPASTGREPQNILESVRGDYVFRRRVRR